MKHFFLATAILATLLPAGAFAATSPMPGMPPHPPESTVTVSGEGLISKSPDEAKLSVSIITNDDNATTSSSKNNDIYNALGNRLNALHLNSDAVRTTGYDVTFIPHPPRNLPPEERQPRYGYVTSRSLIVTISPLSLVGKTIDAATNSGVTEVGNVAFDLKDRHAAYIAALSAAMTDAKQQAEALSSAGGFHLAEVHSVNTGYNPGPPMRMNMMEKPMMARSAMAQATPTEIAPNSPIDVAAHVTVTYLIFP